MVLAAIIIPGGFIALLSAWLGRSLAQTERGRRALAAARNAVPAWVLRPSFPRMLGTMRQAA